MTTPSWVRPRAFPTLSATAALAKMCAFVSAVALIAAAAVLRVVARRLVRHISHVVVSSPPSLHCARAVRDKEGNPGIVKKEDGRTKVWTVRQQQQQQQQQQQRRERL